MQGVYQPEAQYVIGQIHQTIRQAQVSLELLSVIVQEQDPSLFPGMKGLQRVWARVREDQQAGVLLGQLEAAILDVANQSVWAHQKANQLLADGKTRFKVVLERGDLQAFRAWFARQVSQQPFGQAHKELMFAVGSAVMVGETERLNVVVRRRITEQIFQPPLCASK